MIRVKRVHEAPAPTDGLRVLVDRLWPRGLSKEKAKVDLWLREIAPSGSLRKWFAHDPKKWGEFRTRYVAELKRSADLLRALRRREAACRTVTLLYAASNMAHNNAVVLAERLKRCRGARR